MKKILFGAAIAALLTPAPALAQASFPTAASGVRAPGTVPLQCNASGAACAPVTATNPGGPNQVVGTAASGAADDSSAPVKTGGRFNTTPPVLINGQRGDTQLDSSGNALVSLRSGATALTDANGLVVQSALTNSQWSAYVSIGNTTTGGTIKNASGAGVRAYIVAIQVAWYNNTNNSVLEIRDGAAGTVLWRGMVFGAAGFNSVTFPVALRGTANTLIEASTTTAGGASSSVYVSMQGFVSTL